MLETIPLELLLFAGVLVVAGMAMIRSARRFNRTVWGDGACPNSNCRARNKRQARFCNKCGTRLRIS